MNSSLLPPGSSALEKRLAAACGSISGLNVPLRDLWNPWRCPAQFLPYLAWAFSVDRWEGAWSEDEKRKAVSDAFWIHQRKGTVAAVGRVIEALGYSMELTEWWVTRDEPGTFRIEVDVNSIGITEVMVAELERIIGDAKPVSRHIAQLTLSLSASGTAYLGAALCDGETVEVYPQGYEPESGVYYDAQNSFAGNLYFSGVTE